MSLPLFYAKDFKGRCIEFVQFLIPLCVLGIVISAILAFYSCTKVLDKEVEVKNEHFNNATLGFTAADDRILCVEDLAYIVNGKTYSPLNDAATDRQMTCAAYKAKHVRN